MIRLRSVGASPWADPYSGPKNTHLEALQADPWFLSLPVERRLALIHAGRIREYNNNEILYRIGDPPDGIYGLLSGLIRLVSYPQVGNELVAGVLNQGWLGEVSVIDNEPRRHDAIASGKVVVLKISLSEWRELVYKIPAFMEDLARLSCAHIRRQMDEIDALMSHGAEGRLSRLLLQLARPRPGQSNTARVELGQETLANLTGICRQRTNRLLRSMEAMGAIRIGYSYIDVIDPDALAVLDFR